MDLQVPNWDTPGRRLFYGFNFREEWLLNYTTTHWKEHLGNRDIDEYNRGALAACAVWMIQNASAFQHLLLQKGVPDERAKAENTFLSRVKPESVVPLLAMCSSRRSSFKRRPTQAQFDRLVKIVGKEPQWWVESLPED
jgi:hypothetical protein